MTGNLEGRPTNATGNASAMTTAERYRGCLLGLAAGDALGTTAEFSARGSFEPLTDMVGGGPFRLRPGEWTDATSMALCLATSLVERGGFDAHDQMERYCRWRDEGYLSSNRRCFDIGNTVADALSRYRRTGDANAGSNDPQSAGNGSIMRLAPIPMFFHPSAEMVERNAAESSRTTHGAAESVDACRLLAWMISRALAGKSKDDALLGDAATFAGAEKVVAIARGEYRLKSRADIAGSGYVVQSLEAALWCFQETESYRDAVLMSANLGADADTTAAVCGQVAGAYYGESGIPSSWRDCLARSALITTLADDLLRASESAGGGP